MNHLEMFFSIKMKFRKSSTLASEFFPLNNNNAESPHVKELNLKFYLKMFKDILCQGLPPPYKSKRTP